MYGCGADRVDEHRVERKLYRGEQIVIHLKRSGTDEVIEEVWRLEEDGGLVARIRDFCYCPETLAEIAAEFEMPAVNQGYQHPEEYREKSQE